VVFSWGAGVYGACRYGDSFEDLIEQAVGMPNLKGEGVQLRRIKDASVKSVVKLTDTEVVV
jgi:hypothetical protein